MDGTHQIRLGSQSILRPEKLQEFPGGYEPLASIMGVTLDESSFEWTYGAAWFSPASGIASALADTWNTQGSNSPAILYIFGIISKSP